MDCYFKQIRAILHEITIINNISDVNNKLKKMNRKKQSFILNIRRCWNKWGKILNEREKDVNLQLLN